MTAVDEPETGGSSPAAEDDPSTAPDRGHGRTPSPAVAFAALGVLLVAVVASAFALQPRPEPTVVVIGDSITVVAGPAITTELERRWDPVVSGWPGLTIAGQMATARELASRDPEQVVINLGTNDVTGTDDLAPALDSLTEMVALFPDARCIHLVTVSDGIVVPGRDAAARAAELNAGIAALAADDPRLRVIDWAATLREAQVTNPEVVFTEDTVHPEEPGQRLLADAYARSLATCD